MSTKMAEVVLTANGSAVKRILQDLQGSLDAVRNHVDKLKVSIKNNADARKQMAAQGKQQTQEYKTLIADSKALNRELLAEEKHIKALNSAMTHNVKETQSLDIVMKHLATTSTRQLKQSLAQANRELLNMNSQSPGLQKMQQNIAKIKNQIDKNTGSMRTHNSLWKTAVRNITAYVGVFGLFNMVRSKLQTIMDANLQMSDQLSQIRMVSGLAMRDVRKLSDELNRMDTRTTLNDLQQIAYEGSKLGMGKYGVKGLTSFTESANKLNVALKEQMGDDTLTYISKMVETMGMLKKMDIGEAMEKVGSTMFMLSSSSTSTSANIMEFAKRLTAMSKIAGITTPQLLALGSASDSMFLDPEVSATAFIKILQAIPKNAKAIEKQLHLTTGSIKQMVEQGNMMGALTTIFEKMHGQSTSQLAPMFKLLGSEGARMTSVMSAMAQNVDMLEKHVNIANDSFAKGVAIQQEYNLRQQTAQGYLERANNIWRDAFVSTKGVDNVKSLTQEWYDLSKALEESGVFFTEIRLTIWLIAHALAALLLIAPAVIQFFTFKYLAVGIAMMGQSIASTWNMIFAKKAETEAVAEHTVVEGFNTASTGTNTSAQKLNTIATKEATTAQEGFNMAQKANVIAMIATLIFTLIGAFVALRQKTKELTSDQMTLNGSMTRYKENVKATRIEAGMYFDAIIKAADGTKEKEAAIRNANKALAPYLKGISLEHKSLSQLVDIYKLVCLRIQQKLALQAKEDALNKIVKPRIQWEAQRGVEYDAALSKSPGHKAQNSDWVYGVISDAYDKGLTQKQALQLLRQKGGFNVTDQQLNSAYANRSSNYYGRQSGTYSGGKTVFNGVTKGYGFKKDSNFQEQQLFWLASRLSSQIYSTNNQQRTINKAYDKFIGNYTEDTDVPNYTVVDTPEKTKGAGKSGGGHVQELRAELKQVKEDSEALISNIEAWYKMQETAVEVAVTGGKITRQDADALIRDIEKRKNTLLGNARYAIAGEKNNFNELRGSMDSGILTDNSPAAQRTLAMIRAADTDKLRAKMQKFQGSGVEGVNAGYFLDDTKKKGAENLNEAAKSDSKMTESLRQFSEMFGAVASTGSALSKTFTDMGLDLTPIADIADKVSGNEDVLNPSGENGGFAASGQLAGNHDLSEVVVKAFNGMPSDPLQAAIDDWMKAGLDNYKYNPSTEEGIEKWFKGFVEDANGNLKEWAKELPTVMKWDDLMNGQGSGMTYEQSREEFTKNVIGHIKVFYLGLMKSEGEQYERLRQIADKHKKSLETSWKLNGTADAYDAISRGTQQKYNYQKAGGITNLGSAGEMGLTSVYRYSSNDEGVQIAALNLAKTRQMLDEAKQKFGNDALAIKEYSDNMIDAEYAYINAMATAEKSQIDALLQFIEPMKTATEQTGEMLGTLVTKGKWSADGFREIMGNMTKSFADMCLQMVSDEVMRQYKMEYYRKQEKKDTEDNEDDITSAKKAGMKLKIGLEQVASDKIAGILTKGNDKKKKEEKKASAESSKIDSDSANKRLNVQDTLMSGLSDASSQLGQKIIQQHTAQATNNANIEGEEARGTVLAGIAKGAAKIIGTLGPWGAPLIAVITALLMGLLNNALASLFGGKSSEKSTVNTKLKTGMLTYDRGNVGQFGHLIRALDGGEVIGTDGHVYHSGATMDTLSTGLITQPTVTTVNGLPSIVGEKGPEMVIGRETTRAMMLNAPALMRYIVQFDRYHSGVVRPLAAGDMGGMDALAGDISSAPSSGASASADSETLRQLTSAVNTLVTQLQQPIRAEINKWGRGGLVDEVKSGLAFDSKYDGV